MKKIRDLTMTVVYDDGSVDSVSYDPLPDRPLVFFDSPVFPGEDEGLHKIEQTENGYVATCDIGLMEFSARVRDVARVTARQYSAAELDDVDKVTDEMVERAAAAGGIALGETTTESIRAMLEAALTEPDDG